jgi:RimK family alpha-L-glutamate ligase
MGSAKSKVAIVAWSLGLSNGLLRDAWRRLGIAASVLSPPAAVRLLRAGDVAVVRLDVRRTLDGIEAGLDEIAALEAEGVNLLNAPDSVLAAHDKGETADRLLAAGVPHPWTVRVSDAAAVRAFELPFVVKPRFGSWGRDVMRCRDEEEREGCIELLGVRPWFRRQGALLQELLPSTGSDLRVLVAAGRVVGACRRVAASGEWRSNVSLGGSLVPVRAVSSEEGAVAVAATEAVAGDFLEVDVLEDASGRPVVLEINGAADFDGRYSLGGGDVYAEIASALELPRFAGRGRKPRTRTVSFP